MKRLLLIPDGLADTPNPRLKDRTVLQAARVPGLDELARKGTVGLCRTVPKGLPPGSDVAGLSLFGYPPREVYTGRAPLEAASQGIDLADTDLVFRCNFVTLQDDRLADYCAGHITSGEGKILVEALGKELSSEGFEFHPGVSYRNLVIFRDGQLSVETTPPHDITGQPFEPHLPRGKDAEKIQSLMDQARKILGEHEVNTVRRDLGENPADGIWLWGQGTKPALQPFPELRGGIKPAVISAVDLVRGIGKISGCDVLDVPGATGYYDTDYGAKARYAIDAFSDHDLVVVHVEATDEAGHNGEVQEKIRAIESIDREILRPVQAFLEGCGEPFRIVVSPDHPTPLEIKTHTDEPVPFILYGEGVEANGATDYSEAAAAETGLLIEEGHTLIERLIG